MKKIAIGIIIGLAVVLAVGFVPLVSLPYQVTETCYVDEPYEETIETPVPLKYQRLSYGGTVCEIMNRDDAGGNFTFRLTFYSIDQDDYLDALWEREQGTQVNYDTDPRFVKHRLEDTIYIEPGEISAGGWGVMQEVRELAGVPEGHEGVEFWIEVVPDEKVIEETVIKYRQVEEERTVTRYKKVSVFEYLRSRF
mgnify:CR=1 FL=1